MVTHGQQKWRNDVIGCGEERNAVLFRPFMILDEAGLKLRRNQLLDLRNRSLAFVANDKIGLFDSSVDQRTDRVTNQWASKHRHEWLQECFVGAA